MLISVMYHHIGHGRFSNDPELFERHLKYVIDQFNIVVPGDTLSKNQKNICLTFDDAYYDFYYYVFPLLKKYNVKAVLAVPTALIPEKTDASPGKRMSLEHEEIYKNKNYHKFGSFCTWDELREMNDSGFVTMASHSHNHKDLARNDVNLKEEIIKSKKILEEKLNAKVDSFILPFGRYNRKSFDLLQKNYKYIFKVGQGINRDFSGVNGLIYRIDGDNLKDEKSIFFFKPMLGYRIKSFAKSFHDGILDK